MVKAAILAFCLVAAGIWSVKAGTDRNWDLQNYHIFSPFALLQGRLFLDLAAGQVQGFFNPLLHVPWYLSRGLLQDHPRWFAFLWGLPAGLVAYAFLRVAHCHASLLLSDARARLGAVAATAGMGLTGAAFVPGIGLSSGDVWVALPLLVAYGLILRETIRRDLDGTIRMPRLVSAGLLLGLAAGLKLTTVPFSAALGLMLLVTLGLRPAMAAGAATLVGFLSAWLPHAVTLWQATGNPLFPLYNQVFRSPEYLAVPLIDARFLPRSTLQAVFYPFWWLTTTSNLVTELEMRDWRLAIAFLCWPAAAILTARGGVPGLPRASWLLLGTCALAYAGWAALFGIYRYLVFLELLAAILVLQALAQLLRGRGHFVCGTMALLATLTVSTTVRPNWGLGRHGTGLDEIRALPVPTGALVVTTDSEPYGYLVPSLPQGAFMLGLRTNFHGPTQEHGLNRRLRAAIAAHQGPVVVVHAPTDTAGRDATLAAHGLALDGPCQLARTGVVPEGHSFCPGRKLN
jgi:hypothetical protein